METPEKRESIQIPLAYVDPENTTIAFANQFLIQLLQDEFILTVGQVTPPIILGNQRDIDVESLGIDYIPVKVVARLGFTRQRLEELVNLLQENLARYDEMKQGRASDE